MDETNGRNGGIDEYFLRRYRQLLDEEGRAFDELEHAYEEGDRALYEVDFAAWQEAALRRRSFLVRYGLAPEPAVTA